jgi:hypothetical protein
MPSTQDTDQTRAGPRRETIELIELHVNESQAYCPLVPIPKCCPTGVGEDVGKKEPSYTVDGNVD